MTERDEVHEFSDMPDLHCMDREAWGWPKNWGLCTLGGHLRDQGICDGTQCVQFQEVDGEDITTHYYPIPKNVLFLMGDAKTRQDKETKHKIRSALGIN